MMASPEVQPHQPLPQTHSAAPVATNVTTGALHPTMYVTEDVDYEITPELELEIQIIVSKGFSRAQAVQMQSQRLRAERNAEASIRAFQVIRIWIII